MADNIKKLIEIEEENIRQSKDSNEIVNRIYNLIFIKHEEKFSIYTDIKTFIKYYTKLVETNKYGYDSLCYDKAFKVIDLLPYNERISLLNFLISTIVREYPEFEIETIQTKIKTIKIKTIFVEKEWLKIPNAILLWSSLRLSTLFFVLLLFIVIVYVILLPAPTFFTPLFEIKHANYSNNLHLNHILNVLSLFVGIDNSCEIRALNPLGLIELMVGKIVFILVIVNFVYKKITDKISIK